MVDVGLPELPPATRAPIWRAWQFKSARRSPSPRPARPSSRTARRGPTRPRAGSAFVLASDYSPAGDQPAAIKELTEAALAGEQDQVLLGVTGSGKTFTMAKVIEDAAAPGAGARAQQDPRRAALRRVQELLPRQCGRIFRQLLRLLPARGLRPALRHLHREGKLGERGDRPHAPLGDAVAARARRRDHRRLGVVPLRHRLGRDLFGDDLRSEEGRRAPTSARSSASSSRSSTSATTPAFARGNFRVQRRQSRNLPVAL